MRGAFAIADFECAIEIDASPSAKENELELEIENRQ
jgi:hypothetical protein